MKNLLLIVLSITFIGFMGCESDELPGDISSDNVIELRNCNLFSGNDEGRLHNDIVIEVFDNLDTCYSPMSFLDSYNTIIIDNLSSFTSVLNLTDSATFELLESINMEEIKAIVNDSLSLSNYITNNSIISNDLSNSIVPILNYVDGYNFSNSSVSLFQSDLCYFLQNKNVHLSDNDKYLYDVFIDVLVSSNNLWTNSSLGGQGYLTKYQNFINGKCLSSQPRWINWGKVFTIDASTAVVACATSLVATGGAAAIPNPLTGGIPPAGIWGAGAGAAASIGSAIGQS